MKKRSSFRDKVSADSERQKKQGSSYGYLKLPKGINLFKEEAKTRVKLDFLPYKVTDENHLDRNDELGIAVPGELWYKKPFYVHRNVGINNESVVCPTTFGKKCPICEYRAKRAREGADKEELKLLKTSLRNLYVVVPIDNEKLDEQPYLWDVSQYLFQDLLNDEIDEDPDLGRFPDLEEGLTLKIRFSEAMIGKNKFAETSRIDFIERKSAYDEKILSKVPNLDECLTVYSYKELEKMFLEVEVDEDVDEQDAAQEEDEDNNVKSYRVPKDEKEEDIPEKEIIKEDVEEADSKEERKRKRAAKKASKEEEEKNRCPYGHRFGIDCDKFDDCKECELWDDCIDAQED